MEKLDKDTLAKAKQSNTFNSKKEFVKRIEDIRKFAAEDGIEINEESEEDLLVFIESGAIKKDALVLSDDGNFEAIWEGEGEESISLEFIGENIIDYIIFTYKSDEQVIVHKVDSGSFEEVKKLIFELGLEKLIY